MNTFAAYVYLRLLNIVLTDGYKRFSKPSLRHARNRATKHFLKTSNLDFLAAKKLKMNNNWPSPSATRRRGPCQSSFFGEFFCLKGSAESVFLVGGFLKNPVDKYARQNGFIFQFSGWQPPSFHSPKRLNGWF